MAITRKLYYSALMAMLGLGWVIFAASIVISVHDGAHYWTLPEAYRSAIKKLDEGWHYAGLPEDGRTAVIAMHQKWEKEEKLPWWGADELVNPDEQRHESLDYFEKFVPRWGFEFHQEYPITAVMLSLIAFAPFALTIGGARWLAWLRTPE